MIETALYVIHIILLVGVINSLYMAEEIRQIDIKNLSRAFMLNMWVIFSAGIIASTGAFAPYISWTVIFLIITVLGISFVIIDLYPWRKGEENVQNQDNNSNSNGGNKSI